MHFVSYNGGLRIYGKYVMAGSPVRNDYSEMGSSDLTPCPANSTSFFSWLYRFPETRVGPSSF